MKYNYLRNLTLNAALVAFGSNAGAAVLVFDDHPNAVPNDFGVVADYAGYTFSSQFSPTLSWIDVGTAGFNFGAKSGDFAIVNNYDGVGTVNLASGGDFVFDGVWAKKWGTSPESGGADSLFGTLSGYNNGSQVWTTPTGLNGSYEFYGPQAGAIDELRLGFGINFLADDLSLSAVPEPTSAVLSGLTLLGLAFRRRRGRDGVARRTISKANPHSPALRCSLLQQNNQMKTNLTNKIGSTLALASIILAAITANAAASVITTVDFTTQEANVYSYDYITTYNVSGSTSASAPHYSASFNPTFTTGPDGATVSTGTIDLSGSTTFGTASTTYTGQFTIDQNTTYSISGNFSGTGDSVAGSSTNGYLYSYPTSSYLFYDNDYDFPGGAYSFGLNGVVDGLSGSASGSTSGTLVAGTYYFTFQHILYTNTGADIGTINGAGSASLIIGAGASSVPEPGTALFGLLSLGVAAMRRRRTCA